MNYSSILIVLLVVFSHDVFACGGGKCGEAEVSARRAIQGLNAIREANQTQRADCPPVTTAGSSADVKVIKCSEEAPGQSEDQCLEKHEWVATRGSERCDTPEAKKPLFEMVELNPGYFVIRQNKCSSFEAPFMYLMIGETGAFLHDTGAYNEAGNDIGDELRRLIDEVLAKKEKQTGKPIQLTVGHGHSHGDHTEGDSAFANRPNTRVVGLSPQEITAAYGIRPAWPDGEGEIDLGGRKLSVIPIPGHERSSVAFYDQTSHDILSGDSLYPGNVFVNGSWSRHRESTARLAAFAARNPVRMILGSHVEMQKTAGQDYDYGTKHQPNEHSLVLRHSHLTQMNDYLQATPSAPSSKKVFDDFMVVP